jgi:hypothetical protein
VTRERCTCCVGVFSYLAGATPVQACGNLAEGNGRKSYAVYGTYVNYQYLSSLATMCGLPASTVTLTPPALDTCDGAYSKFVDLSV